MKKTYTKPTDKNNNKEPFLLEKYLAILLK